ncbi:MAG TPA: pyridoxamine 5'-phosphate oxidase [Steroidobacteraceae bacterium]|nr:pyridoxamine 5'-phosphate oxidase [Steroidobacteraceae bacterium]
MSENPNEEWTESLPDPLPGNPLQVVADWLAQARADAAQPNPNSMVLATVDSRGQPSARVVLCKDIAAEAGYLTFYTNYLSRKGRELEMNPRAAIVFHWDHRHRQVRAEGRVARLPAAESDAYFSTRPWPSRLGAWASRQSEPVDSRAAMCAAVTAAAQRLGVPYGGPGSAEPAAMTVDIPRPAAWGGYRLNVESVELWVEGVFRIHDRARWTRDSDPERSGDAMNWSVTRLQP